MAALMALLAPYALRLAIGLGVIAALGGGYAFEHHRIYQLGYARAVHDVAVQNKEAVDAVDQARARVRDCNARERMRWDQVAGECVGRD